MKWLPLTLLIACTPAQDPQAFLDYEASFLRPGVDLEKEEGEVRRVLAQRGLRLQARVQEAGFIALGAASRRASAVRVITGRGVVLAEDAEVDDLFQPSSVALLERFGGTLGEYTLVAYTRTPAHQDVGCVTLERVQPDASVIECVLDVSDLGARACVSALSPGRNGQLRAKVAWPSLRSASTPQLDVELAFAPEVEARDLAREREKEPGRAPRVQLAPGPWLDQETTRYNAAQLTKADFAARHAIGVARAVLAKLAGKSASVQVDLYRNAVGAILPASPESDLVGETLRHIQSSWLDAPPAPPSRERAKEPEPESPPTPNDIPPDEAIIVEPPAGPR